MATWARFRSAAPELAEAGRGLIYARGDGEALLATVRRDDPPRIHPINVGVVEGGLYAFLLDSPKRRDLIEDGRYALHTHQDPAAPSEFMIRGMASLVNAPATRAAVAADWPFGVDESYDLFAFDIASAVLGVRPTANDWPPVYTRWTDDAGDA